MPLASTLSTIEAQLQDMQAALLSSDALALQTGAEQLRQAVQALGQACAQAGAPAQWPDDLRARVQATAARLAQLRTQLARVLALTERQAAVLLPPLPDATYGAHGTTVGSRGARIYRAPG